MDGGVWQRRGLMKAKEVKTHLYPLSEGAATRRVFSRHNCTHAGQLMEARRCWMKKAPFSKHVWSLALDLE